MVRYAGYGGDSVEDLILTVIEGPYVLRDLLCPTVSREVTLRSHTANTPRNDPAIFCSPFLTFLTAMRSP
jgi:hypothetical protein